MWGSWLLYIFYSEYRTKNFTGDSKDVDQITYTQQKIFFFDNKTSGAGLAETDMIYTINIPLVVSMECGMCNTRIITYTYAST